MLFFLIRWVWQWKWRGGKSPAGTCVVQRVLTAEARGCHSWASVCSRPSPGRTMDDPGEDPDFEPVDEEILDIELLDGVDEDDNLEEEDEDDTEEVFETPRKRPSILLSLTGCSRVALSPFSDLEVPQTRLDPPTPSSPLSRSPSQFLRYPQKPFGFGTFPCSSQASVPLSAIVKGQ